MPHFLDTDKDRRLDPQPQLSELCWSDFSRCLWAVQVGSVFRELLRFDLTFSKLVHPPLSLEDVLLRALSN